MSLPPAPALALNSDEVRLLRGLIEVPSVSGQEAAAVRYLVEQMRLLGMDSYTDDAGNAVGVVEHASPARASTDIVLLGHVDTVPGDIPVRIEGDLLFGRGAVDAKGPLAAFVLAASRARIPPGCRLVVVGAVEEEAPTSRGARHIASAYRPAACIIGEPSGWDGVTLGYKGSLLVEYRDHVACSHAASSGESAADRVCRWWEDVRHAAGAMQPSDSPFERVQATLRRVATESDGLHDRAEALANFRLPPGVPSESVLGICRRHAPAGATVSMLSDEQAHVADRNNPVARAITAAIRAAGATPRPKRKTGTCDMNVVAPMWNCPIAAYGPGDSALDHTPGEHLSLAEFARSIAVLTAAVETLAIELAPGPSPSPVSSEG
jgi:[amino group carrier protein]-lysine/ornithine hydrolase